MNLHIRDDVVGFGDEQSRRGRTVNGNYFIRVTTVPCAGGADITIETKHGLKFSDGSTTLTKHVRKEFGPRIGERVMLHGRLVKVADRYWDSSGRLLLFDEDTQAWCIWEGAK